MTAEELIREALHDGMKLKAPARVAKYQRAEGALNALGAARAAAAEVVAIAREVDAVVDADQRDGWEPLERLAAVLRKYDAVLAGLPEIAK